VITHASNNILHLSLHRYNLAVCLAPSILKQNEDDDSAVNALLELPKVLKVVEFMIVHVDYLASKLNLGRTLDDEEMEAARTGLAKESEPGKQVTAEQTMHKTMARPASGV